MQRKALADPLPATNGHVKRITEARSMPQLNMPTNLNLAPILFSCAFKALQQRLRSDDFSSNPTGVERDVRTT